MKIKNAKDFELWIEGKSREVVLSLITRMALRAIMVSQMEKFNQVFSDICSLIFGNLAFSTIYSESSDQEALNKRKSKLTEINKSVAKKLDELPSTASKRVAIRLFHISYIVGLITIVDNYVEASNSAVSRVVFTFNTASNVMIAQGYGDEYGDSYGEVQSGDEGALVGVMQTYLWKAVTRDVELIEKNFGVNALNASPLWWNIDLPKGFNKHWNDLKSYLGRLNQNWEVWTDWYDDRLLGKPLNDELEIGDPDNEKYGRVTFPFEDYEYPNIINLKIKKLIEEYTRNNLSLNAELDIEEIAKATPLAENIVLNDDGIFEVEFIPVSILSANNINRLKDAIDNSVDANSLGANSSEAKFLRNTINKHANNPQRLFDDCRLIRKELKRLISKGVVPDDFAITRLIDALLITETDILANNPEVQSAVDARNALSLDQVGKDSFNPEKLKPNVESALPVASTVLQDNLLVDATAACVGQDRANAIYRLLSRASRMIIGIRLAVSDEQLSQTAKVALVKAQPHLQEILEILRPFLAQLG